MLVGLTLLDLASASQVELARSLNIIQLDCSWNETFESLCGELQALNDQARKLAGEAGFEPANAGAKGRPLKLIIMIFASARNWRFSRITYVQNSKFLGDFNRLL